MNFLELDFLLFSGGVAIIAWLVRGRPRLRDIWLVLASFIFLATWNWQSCLVAILNAGLVFLIGKGIVGSDRVRGRWFLGLGIALQVALLVLARHLTMDTADGHYSAQLRSVTFLIGVSFFTLQNIAYLTQLVDREITSASSFLDFLLFSIYFPKVLVGPIESYHAFSTKLAGPRGRNLWEALYLIALGFFKSLVISNRILDLYGQMIRGYSTPEKPIIAIWAAMVMTSIIMYCDFSALSDVGRGVSRLLGIDLVRNFNQPYFASNPFDYWSRWHITMSEWMRRHIYFPVLLRFKNVLVALSVTMFAVALWHGTSPWLFLWAFAWVLFQYGYVYTRGYSLGGIGVRWRKVIAVLFTFHLSGLIGLYTIHRIFFEPQFPNFSILMDSYSLRTLGINFQVWIFVFLMIAIESLERRMQSDRFYALAAIFLVWITATFMSGTSYLFYYMRL